MTSWAAEEQREEEEDFRMWFCRQRRVAFPRAESSLGDDDGLPLRVSFAAGCPQLTGEQLTLPRSNIPDVTHPHLVFITRRSTDWYRARPAPPPPFTDRETEVQSGLSTLIPSLLPPQGHGL